MNYTIKQLNKDFPDDNACLDYIFNLRYGKNYTCPKCHKKGFYRIKTRKCYGCAWCGYQIYPLKGTIFSGSATDLYNWFYALYRFSTAKNGVSAKELQGVLGITYKTAWRIAHLIRSLMKQDGKMLNKEVEIDEFYYGGKKRGITGTAHKKPVLGMVERKGRIKAKVVEEIWTPVVLKSIVDNIERGTHLITDDATYYPKTKRLGYFHSSVCHSKKEFVRGKVYTNTIEGFWSQMKRSIYGTYHSVSPKHLQSYVDEFAYRYNQRFSSVSAFEGLLLRLCELPYQGGQKMPAFGVKVFS